MEGSPEESDRTERGESAGTTPGLSDDDLYRALASTRRRRLLYLLLDEGERTVEEIATVLTGWEATERGTMRTPQDRERITVDLEHTHLPLLAEAGLVAYDRPGGSVRIRPLDSPVSTLVRQSVDPDDAPARDDV